MGLGFCGGTVLMPQSLAGAATCNTEQACVSSVADELISEAGLVVFSFKMQLSFCSCLSLLALSRENWFLLILLISGTCKNYE